MTGHVYLHDVVARAHQPADPAHFCSCFVVLPSFVQVAQGGLRQGGDRLLLCVILNSGRLLCVQV